MAQNNESTRLSPEQLLATPDGIVVTLEHSLNEEEINQIWSMLTAGFSALNRNSYEKQDMTKHEFLEDANSGQVFKYLARTAETSAVEGYMTVHVGLGAINWVNKDRLLDIQHTLDPHAVPYYVNTLVVDKNLRGTAVAKRLLQGGLSHFRQQNISTKQDSLVFFDCADANYPWLGEYIKRSFKSDDSFSGIDAEMTEVMTEYWLKNDDDTVSKVAELPEGLDPSSLLDKQHYYSIRLLSTA